MSRTLKGMLKRQRSLAEVEPDTKFDESLRSAWSEGRKAATKDIPRLSPRTTILLDEGVIVRDGRLLPTPEPLFEEEEDEPIPKISGLDKLAMLSRGESLPVSEPSSTIASTVFTSESKAPADPDFGSAHALLNVIQVLLDQLDSSSEKIDEFKKSAAEYTEKKDKGEMFDHEEWMATLFDSALKGTKTLLVLQAIHQGIIFPCIMLLRTKAFGPLGNVKDVRSSDGWKVLIEIRKAGSIAITHLRKEQSMDPPDSPKHWKVSWEVRMSFDKEMKDLRSNFLRITNLDFHESMDKEDKDWITSQLVGNVIL